MTHQIYSVSIYSENYNKDYYKSNSFGIGPFIRFYFNTKKVKPFFNGGLGLGTTNIKQSSSNGTSGNTLFFEIGTGIGFFVNMAISLDIAAEYEYEKFKPLTNNTNNYRVISRGFKAGIGFSIHPGSKKITYDYLEIINLLNKQNT